MWPSANVVMAGASFRQTSIASGQRGWKWQPAGGASGLGISPRTAPASSRRRGSGWGIASSSVRTPASASAAGTAATVGERIVRGAGVLVDERDPAGSYLALEPHRRVAVRPVAVHHGVGEELLDQEREPQAGLAPEPGRLRDELVAERPDLVGPADRDLLRPADRGRA